MLRIAFLCFLYAYLCFLYSSKPGTASPSPPLSQQKPTTKIPSIPKCPYFTSNSEYVQLLILLLLLISKLIQICLFYSQRVRYIPFYVARNLLNKQSPAKPTCEPYWSPHIFGLTFFLLECDFSRILVLIYIFEPSVCLFTKC